jgi:phytoene dehydrogenase-like protein
MGAVSRCLAEAARAAGAEIRAAAPVARVVVRDGRAAGVELEDGTEVPARAVVSGAHPKTTYLDLVGEEHLPPEVVRDIRRYRTRSGSVKVNLALGELPVPTAWDGPVPGDSHRGLIAISPSVEYLERAWDEAKYGGTSSEPYIEAVFPTVFEPELARRGSTSPCASPSSGRTSSAGGRGRRSGRPWEDGDPDPGGVLPQPRGGRGGDGGTAPPDIEERFGLVGGNIFQGETTPDQLFSLRPIPGYGDYRTPVKGLYLCGSGTHPGGGVMAVPARNAARVVLRDQRRQRFPR